MQGEEQELGGGSSGSSAPIIIKKISRGGGHHGGAWKVAFADFVTAMMALFMVLWLMNSNENEKDAIAAYFHDPKGFAEKWGSSQPAITISKDDLGELADKIQAAMKEGNSGFVERGRRSTLLTILKPSAFGRGWDLGACVNGGVEGRAGDAPLPPKWLITMGLRQKNRFKNGIRENHMSGWVFS